MINKFVPLSPDPFLNSDPDMSLAKFGHINAIVEYINNSGGLKLSGDGLISGTIKSVLDPAGSSTPLRMSNSSITNYGGGSITSNTAFGTNALGLNSTGANNTAFGGAASYNNTSGGNNTAIGYLALALSNASNNTAIGYRSLSANTSGTQNVAVGSDALLSNITGSANTVVGYQALIQRVHIIVLLENLRYFQIQQVQIIQPLVVKH